jgi:hypothetical protein
MASEILELSPLPAPAPSTARPGAFAVSVTEITDARGADPCFILPKLRLGGQVPEGAYMAERPVAEILKEALAARFDAAGMGASGKGRACRLSGKLLALDFAVSMGFQGCMVRAALTMDLTLRDSGSGAALFEGALTGNGRAGLAPLVPDAFTGAVDELFANVTAGLPAA